MGVENSGCARPPERQKQATIQCEVIFCVKYFQYHASVLVSLAWSVECGHSHEDHSLPTTDVVDRVPGPPSLSPHLFAPRFAPRSASPHPFLLRHRPRARVPSSTLTVTHHHPGLRPRKLRTHQFESAPPSSSPGRIVAEFTGPVDVLARRDQHDDQCASLDVGGNALRGSKNGSDLTLSSTLFLSPLHTSFVHLFSPIDNHKITHTGISSFSPLTDLDRLS